MCRLKSAIILKNRIFIPDYDNHNKMLKELGIKDDYLNASKTFVRAELSPKNNDVFSDIDTWELNVDQDITPDWFDKNKHKQLMIKAVKEWAKNHIHIGVNNLKINTGMSHYIKDCQNTEICDLATIEHICGSTTIERICDSATVKRIYDPATVKRIYDSATVERICGSTTIERICGSATVKYIYDSATIKYIYDLATIEHICGSTTIERICDSATVKRIYDPATVEHIYGSATMISSPYTEWKNSNKVNITDNATFKDCYTKTIYQSGDWKLIKV